MFVVHTIPQAGSFILSGSDLFEADWNVLADMVCGWQERQFINRKNVITDGISQAAQCQGVVSLVCN